MNQTSAAPPWPAEIRLAKDRRVLKVMFDDGASFELSAELLRVTSPSAEVQGHSEIRAQDDRRQAQCQDSLDRSGRQLCRTPRLRRHAQHRDLFVGIPA